MSGETEAAPSGWTTDTILAHIEAELATHTTNMAGVVDALGIRLDAQATAQRETVEAHVVAADHRFEQQQAGLTERHAALMRLLDERYETQVTRLDAAVLSQKEAMHTAFIAADRAVVAALESAEKAVNKAEMASEKRFSSVNEFRATLTDQAATFMTTPVAEARYVGITEKIDSQVERTNQRFVDINHRLDISDGRDSGSAARDAKMFAVIGAAGGLLAIIISVATIIFHP